MESESDRLRVKRRSAKGKFTRQMRTVEAMVLHTRSHSEVYINWETLQRLYDELQDSHGAFTETIDPKDDATYDEEENWMEKCREMYVNVSMSVTDYIRNIRSKDCIDPTDSSITKSVGTAIATRDEKVNESATGNPSKLETGYEEKATANHDTENRTSTFKLQFNQMPKFSGDVREYATFRSDFKDLIEPKCSKRDAITLLRNNLFDKPYELIKGIGNDYIAAWEYLDSVYGDPRVVADAITYDITSFRALEEEEDNRFCELCHLVRRSFNTLKDIGRQADLDNNHMLAIIEQKMSRDDRKIWSRKVEENKIPATLEQLLNWMTIEMKSRMRASALIREEPSSVSRVHCVSSREYNNGPRSYAEMSHRCWICRSSTHWVDECEQFRSIPPAQRVDMVKRNNACFCCLKRTGKNHTSNSCFRRRQCLESNGQDSCKQYHHPLLHVAAHNVSCDAGLVGVAGTACDGVMLPVIGAYIHGDNKWKSGSVLLDSGAQISLIRTQLADELGLSGKDVTITMNKVGGDEETLKTKRYKISLQSMDSKNTVSVYAIGIPYITDDISSITDVGKKARELKIPVKDIHRRSGAVDVLVGTDHPRLHTGQTKAAGNVVARRSPIGWVLFGTDGQVSGSNRVLNIQISKTVIFSDCGKTEGMSEDVHGYSHDCESDERSCLNGHTEQLIDESTRVKNVNHCRLYPRKGSSRTRPGNIRLIETLISTEKKRTNRDHSANIERELHTDRMDDIHSQKSRGGNVSTAFLRAENLDTEPSSYDVNEKVNTSTKDTADDKSVQTVPGAKSETQFTGLASKDKHQSHRVHLKRAIQVNIPEYCNSKQTPNLETTERISNIQEKGRFERQSVVDRDQEPLNELHDVENRRFIKSPNGTINVADEVFVDELRGINESAFIVFPTCARDRSDRRTSKTVYSDNEHKRTLSLVGYICKFSDLIRFLIIIVYNISILCQFMFNTEIYGTNELDNLYTGRKGYCVCTNDAGSKRVEIRMNKNIVRYDINQRFQKRLTCNYACHAKVAVELAICKQPFTIISVPHVSGYATATCVTDVSSGRTQAWVPMLINHELLIT